MSFRLIVDKFPSSPLDSSDNLRKLIEYSNPLYIYGDSGFFRPQSCRFTAQTTGKEVLGSSLPCQTTFVPAARDYVSQRMGI